MIDQEEVVFKLEGFGTTSGLTFPGTATSNREKLASAINMMIQHHFGLPSLCEKSSADYIDTDGVEVISKSNALQLFSFENKQVRVVMKDNHPWLVAKDVCDVLELTNPTEALKALDDDEKMTLRNSEGHSGKRGGAQMLNIINESGTYALILRSNKPEAKRFRKWITSEVLPFLQQTGRYEVQKTLPPISLQEREIAIREKHAEARYLEALAKSTREQRLLAKENQNIATQ